MKSSSVSLTRVIHRAGARPFEVDVVFAVAIGLLTTLGYYTADVVGSERSQDLFGLVLIAGQTVAFVFRRRAPLTSMLAVVGFTAVFWVADYPTDFGAFSLLAVYAAAAHGGDDRRRVWLLVGSMVAFLTTIAVLGVLYPSEALPAAAVIGIAALHLTAAVAGEVVHERRLRLDALEQRAVRAETERELLAREAVLDERARIARDMHDVVAHGVSVMVVQAGAAERMVPVQPELALDALRHIQASGREALAEMRRMLGVLRDDDWIAARAPQPQVHDLDHVVQTCIEAGVATELIVEGAAAPRAAGPEMAGYRIVQEALTNVIKHAGRPTHAVVKVTYLDQGLRVEVTDDGGGSSTSLVERATGHGLIGMRERVELYGGSLHVGPRPGGGFRVSATIPYDPPGTAT